MTHPRTWTDGQLSRLQAERPDHLQPVRARPCTFPGCQKPVVYNELCIGHNRQYQAKGFLMPLGPAWRQGETWTPAFAVQFATDLLTYHAPERLVPELRPADPGRG